MLNDEYILEKFFSKSGKLNGNFSTREYLEKNYPEVLKYLENRFSDSESLRETFLRIYFKIEERPKCPVCGKKVSYRGKRNTLFSKTCGNSYCYCKVRDVTMLKKYGVTNRGGSPESIEKGKKTKLLKYGDEWYSNKEKRKKTCLERYGKEYAISDEIIEKRKKTCLERYGDEKYRNIEKIKKTCLERYGVDNYRKSTECLKKISEAKRKNNTFVTSKIEENCYIWLCEEYGKEDIIRQYKDIRYTNPKNNTPFHCDFYISSKDIFIEIQGHFAHGPHPYDPLSKEDNKILNEWKHKVEIKKNSMYQRAIEGWTISDPLKRKIAKDNNIKYIEIFNRKITKDELIKTINEYGCIS